MEAGENFYKILLNDILNDISISFNALNYDLKNVEYDTFQEVFDEKVKEMKAIINCYIDEQSSVIKKTRNCRQLDLK